VTDGPPGGGLLPPAAQLARAPRPAPGARRAGARPAWQRALLGVPLTVKLAGANLVVLLLAVIALVYAAGRADHLDAWIVGGALALGFVVNSLLVRYALRPVWELEHVASRVWAGDFAARVPGSDVADREMSRVGRTFNLLLDSLARASGLPA